MKVSPRLAPSEMDACAREPIHIPGSIQPHGVLLCVAHNDGCITQASANAARVLGPPEGDAIGRHWSSLVRLDELADPGERPWHSDWIRAKFPALATPPRQTWSACCHFYDNHWLVELEPDVARFDEDPVRQGYELARQLDRDADVTAACRRTARLVRHLLGYDRVMLYRFDAEWNGEVIAESVREDLEPYLGLHYPASDIPAQARVLYLSNRVRTIGDVAYKPCPIIPERDAASDRPLDLSDVSLRSVSPIHLEYLGNMGVTATLVASIIVSGRLWGLISCHHYASQQADHGMRELADSVARALAGRIATLEVVAMVDEEARLDTVREKLITAFHACERIDTELLAGMAPILLDAVDADGVAIFTGESIHRHGQLPDEAGLKRVRACIETAADLRDEVTGVVSSEALCLKFPQLSDLAAVAAGIVYMPLIRGAHSAVLWVRHEQVQDVRWGGNPYLSKLQEIEGARLSPRQSFATWQETVRGRSRPWSPLQLESARNLRVMIEVMERKYYQRNFSLMRHSLERVQSGVLLMEAIDRHQWQEAPITFANETMAALLHRTVESLQGIAFVDLLHEAGAGSFERSAQALSESQSASIEMLFCATDGQPLSLRFDISAISDSAGGISHWMATHRATG